MEKKKRARIELIDIAKALTIFLVILGHTTGNLDTPLYRRVLYSFHMPLFFFLAGIDTSMVTFVHSGYGVPYSIFRKLYSFGCVNAAVPYYRKVCSSIVGAVSEILISC